MDDMMFQKKKNTEAPLLYHQMFLPGQCLPISSPLCFAVIEDAVSGLSVE